MILLVNNIKTKAYHLNCRNIMIIIVLLDMDIHVHVDIMRNREAYFLLNYTILI